MLRSAVSIVLSMWIAVPDAAQPGDLPHRDTFFKEVREALARSQEVWHRYAYTERRTELHMNPFGRMGTGGTRVSEVRPHANPQLTYRRVIERNGVQVAKHELDRQDAEYRARVARVQRGVADADDDDRLARTRAQLILDDAIKTLQFELDRREMRHDRPMIVVTFAAKPAARPQTREGRLARVFAGSVWIDEASREVIEVRAVAKGAVSFGGFIAKVYEGTEAVVERREIETGVWMPTRVTLSGDVRALFRKTRIDHVIEWYDYRRVQ
jgi:hypothetical protein